jgi:hypothetical protein
MALSAYLRLVGCFAVLIATSFSSPIHHHEFSPFSSSAISNEVGVDDAVRPSSFAGTDVFVGASVSRSMSKSKPKSVSKRSNDSNINRGNVTPIFGDGANGIAPATLVEDGVDVVEPHDLALFVEKECGVPTVFTNQREDAKRELFELCVLGIMTQVICPIHHDLVQCHRL